MDPHDTDFLNQTRAWYAAGERDVDSRCGVGKWGDSFRVIEGPGATRLFAASVHGWCASMRWLIDHGADVNYCLGSPVHSGGKSALHAALSHGGFDVASMLLDAGARVDAVDCNGRTPLHEAPSFIHARNMKPIAACKRLLSLGASLYAIDVAGETPEDYARRGGCTQAANFLADVRSAGSWAAYVAERAPRCSRSAGSSPRSARAAARPRRRASPHTSASSSRPPTTSSRTSSRSGAATATCKSRNPSQLYGEDDIVAAVKLELCDEVAALSACSRPPSTPARAQKHRGAQSARSAQHHNEAAARARLRGRRRLDR